MTARHTVPIRPESAPRGARLWVITLAGVLTAAGLIGALGALTTGFEKTSGGEIAVVRNGGPLDDNRIRQVIPPASSRTWTGLFSQVHKLPAQQRFYTITADSNDGDKPGVDVAYVPSADGVNLGIEGTIYFRLNTETSVIRSFDDTFATRTFRGADGEQRYVYDGTDGFLAFLDQIIRPVIDNALREQIGTFRCYELQAACALVQSSARTDISAAVGKNNTNIAKVQEAVNRTLAEDIKSQLGGPYLTGIRFNLSKVTLPTEVQAAVNKAQAAFAGVTEAQAKVAQARAEASANEARQRGYSHCPACAQIDMLKSIPPSVTTYAPGGGFAVTPSGK